MIDMDITHFYLEQGSGEPLVLLHGNGEDSGTFSRNIPAFAEHFHVYAPDTRGHGRTPRGSAPFTIRQFAEDLLAFLDAHGLEKIHLLGFSDGANIAMIFALRHPERLGKLILDGGNLDPSGVKQSVQRPIELAYRLCARGRSPRARARAEMLGLMVNDPALSPEELTAIRSETLVMAGTKDLIKREHTECIAAHIPGARLVFIEGDHFIAGKNPAAFNRAVLDFLL